MKRVWSVLAALLLLTTMFAPGAQAAATAVTTEAAVAEEAQEALKDTTMKVEVKAKSMILMEASTHRVLMASNEHQKLFPASVTKIMTMLLVCEAIDAGKIALTDTVVASENAASKGGSQIWLKVGETMTVHELLKATAVYSANDACTLLGEHIAGSEAAFNEMLNRRAKELGMKDTFFENCTGLDDTAQNHLTTAYDIALMSAELLKHKLIFDYTTIWMDSLRGGATELVNTNKLVRTYKGITGLKTGTTAKAGNCVSATAQRDGLHLIAVVMGSDNTKDRFDGARAMLDWGFSHYEAIVPAIDKTQIADVQVLHGQKQSLTPVLPPLRPILTLKGSGSRITQKTELAADVEAPVEKGQVLGKVQFYLDEELLCEYTLSAGEEIARLRFFDAFRMILRAFATQEVPEDDETGGAEVSTVDAGGNVTLEDEAGQAGVVPPGSGSVGAADNSGGFLEAGVF